MKKEKDFYQVSLKVILKNEKGETLILKASWLKRIRVALNYFQFYGKI